MDWIKLAVDKVHYPAPVRENMNLNVPKTQILRQTCNCNLLKKDCTPWSQLQISAGKLTF
jgi:hypothetical protein